jgi:DivIVA domain-containing protein
VLVVEIVLAAVVVCGVAAVAMGYGGSITHFAPDWPGRTLPEDRTLRADDVTHARFSLAFRGYRMSEVDAVLDRLAFELNQRDARIEQLSGRPYESIIGDDAGLIAPPAAAPELETAPADDRWAVPSSEPSPASPAATPDAAGAGDAAEAASEPTEEPIFEQTYADNPYAPPRDDTYARPRDDTYARPHDDTHARPRDDNPYARPRDESREQ